MGFKHKTFAARAAFLMESYTQTYLLVHMKMEELTTFPWPADDMDSSVHTVMMDREEARIFLIMLKDDIVEKQLTAEKDADRSHELDMVRAATNAPRQPLPPAVADELCLRVALKESVRSYQEELSLSAIAPRDPPRASSPQAYVDEEYFLEGTDIPSESSCRLEATSPSRPS